MARGECPNRALSCKYYPKCFSDEHHEYYPRRIYEEGYDNPDHNVMAARWRNLGSKLVQLCRLEHDWEHELEPPQRPPLDHMVEELEATDEHLTNRVLEAIQRYKNERSS